MNFMNLYVIWQWKIFQSLQFVNLITEKRFYGTQYVMVQEIAQMEKMRQQWWTAQVRDTNFPAGFWKRAFFYQNIDFFIQREKEYIQAIISLIVKHNASCISSRSFITDKTLLRYTCIHCKSPKGLQLSGPGVFRGFQESTYSGFGMWRYNYRPRASQSLS